MNHIVYIRFPAGCNINVIFMQHIHNTLVIPLQRNQFYNPQIMNELTEIYKRIEYLRNNGVKMKEIADRVDMAPSVLSALYSSVLPRLHRPAENPHTGRRTGRSAGTGQQCLQKTLIK